MTNSSPTENFVKGASAFLFSLVMGTILGALFLGAGMFLLKNLGLAGQTAVFLGITNKTPWYFTRSAGTVAYILLSASTIWGLLLSTKIIKETVPAVLSMAMHNFLSWAAVGITGLHVVSLLFDSYYNYRLADLVIPFIGPYRPGWVGLGIIGYYITILTTLSFYWRKQIGQKRWRALHYLTFGAYTLATVHGIMAGTDSASASMNALYWGSGLLVLFLTNYRILSAGAVKGRVRQANA
ncbi:MAG: hypothetical protein D6835_05080 [Candidatus Thermofonsia bacterium]|nr:MAG: hypothetical protein D6835_05080 [Candidatus Thermofonsia bacterium]